MHLIDTHTHLYVKQFEQDRSECVQRAIKEGVQQMLLPNIDSSTISSMMELCQQFPQNCFPMIGLHPCDVKANYQEELEIVERWLQKEPFIAIGEIGMDLHWDKSTQKIQEKAFRQQIALAKKYQLPVAIHVRDCFDEVLCLVDELNDDDLKGVFHCFTGTQKQAHHILSYGGFKLGIGGVVTFKNSNLEQTLKDIPLQQLLLETDSPYLAPTPHRGKRNESSYLLFIAQKIADIYQLSLEEVAAITTQNAKELFEI